MASRASLALYNFQSFLNCHPVPFRPPATTWRPSPLLLQQRGHLRYASHKPSQHERERPQKIKKKASGDNEETHTEPTKGEAAVARRIIPRVKTFTNYTREAREVLDNDPRAARTSPWVKQTLDGGIKEVEEMAEGLEKAGKNGRSVSKATTSEKPRRRRRISGNSIVLTLLFSWLGALAWKYTGLDDVLFPASPQTLNTESFTPFELLDAQPVSSTSSILGLRAVRKKRANAEQDEKDIGIYQRAFQDGIWSVEFQQPQMQISRAYTPLPPDLDTDNGVENGHQQDLSQLRFLIRKEPSGEVSSYISNLPPGSIISLRGPHLEYKISPDLQEIVFLAGGTSIAPALQVAYSLFEGRSQELAERAPRLRVLWANRRREDCSGAIVEQLGRLQAKYPGRITVRYFVDEEKRFIEGGDLDAVLAGPAPAEARGNPPPSQLNAQAQQNTAPTPALVTKNLVLVSGPDGFVNHLAGPKTWWNGKEAQGPLGGVLGALDAEKRGWSVWKL